jgi:hypothetical protein
MLTLHYSSLVIYGMEQEQSSEMYSHRIGPEVTEQVEFGAFRKLDRTTPRKGSV